MADSSNPDNITSSGSGDGGSIAVGIVLGILAGIFILLVLFSRYAKTQVLLSIFCVSGDVKTWLNRSADFCAKAPVGKGAQRIWKRANARE